MNLKHPHDLVILMRQETTVNYLKELEVSLVFMNCIFKKVLWGAESEYKTLIFRVKLVPIMCSQLFELLFISEVEEKRPFRWSCSTVPMGGKR